MNKTVTINISGIIFHIEEDAYDKLSKYLNTIKGYFSKADGGSEIMSDIEARIAEMLQSKTSAIKQVVLMSDVDFVMDNMGKPEEFAGDEQANTQNTSNSDYSEYITNEPVKRRLYRDGDSKVLGGVCSGIANYFDIDVVWIRIALLLLTFFAGLNVIFYIILWIAIPEAKTTAEKLAMKGEKADINNISKAVKEEAEQLKKRMEKYGKEFTNMASNSDAPRNVAEKFIDFLGDVFRNIGRVLLKIVGVIMVIFGVIIFLFLAGSVFGLSVFNIEYLDLIFLEGSDFYIGIVGVFIFIGIPVLMLIFWGIKILFKINYTNRWLNLTAGIIWLIGFLILLFSSIKTLKDFNKDGIVREKIDVIQKDTMYLKMNELVLNYNELDGYNKQEEGERNHSSKHRFFGYILGVNNGKNYLLNDARLKIVKSSSNNFELVIVKEAQGGYKQIATERAKNIIYSVSQKDSLIQFDNLFKIVGVDKLRAQDVTVILKVPVGKVIYLDKSLEDLIYDVGNITETNDGDMINRRWIMTANGLKCLDCDGITDNSDKNNSDEDDTEKDVKITVNGVDVDNKDVQVKLDTNGIHIHTKKK
jgi:phage shock protein PspC (stress-responsive transcriptional regulator)